MGYNQVVGSRKQLEILKNNIKELKIRFIVHGYNRSSNRKCFKVGEVYV